MATYLKRAENISVSHNFIAQVWRDHALQPQRQGTFKLSNDPDFEAKVADVVGLYQSTISTWSWSAKADQPGDHPGQLRTQVVDQRRPPRWTEVLHHQPSSAVVLGWVEPQERGRVACDALRPESTCLDSGGRS